MKKIVLFAAAMIFCAGIAFAQQPAKKNTDKANTTATATTTKEVKNEQRQHCGKCPHHAQGNKNTAATVKTDNKSHACEGKKNCCKEQKQPANKSNNNAAAVKK